MTTHSHLGLPRLLLLLLGLSAVAAPAQAQRLAYRIKDRNTNAPISIGVIDLATGVGVPATADEAQVGAVFTSDGRYAVNAPPAGPVTARDMRNGQQVTLPPDFRPGLAHPRRATIYGLTFAGELARLDVRGLARWRPCPAGTVPISYDLSRDGAQLFVACGTAEVLVIDADSGTEIRRVPSGPATVFVAVNASSELVAVSSASSQVSRLDATTGQVLATRAALPFWGHTGSRRQLLEVSPSATPGVTGVYRLIDASTLAVSLVLPASVTIGIGIFVSPDGRDAVFYNMGYTFLTPSRVTRFDLTTGLVVAELVLPQTQIAEVTVTPVPLPPESPRASVAGGVVTLTWQLPVDSPQATGYWLDVGTAPGAANLGSFFVGAADTFTGGGAPPGRYYLRLRAVNDNGSSAPSAEFTVTVPAPAP